jgi:hypothetical protein
MLRDEDGSVHSMQEAGIVLAKIMADPAAPADMKAAALRAAIDMIKAGAMALGLATDKRHKETCDQHDHTPAGFLEHIASGYAERNDALEVWEDFYEEFWQELDASIAENSLKNLPETIHVSDILGEGEKG